MKSRGIKYPRRLDASKILATKAKRQQQLNDIVDLTDDAIYDSYLKSGCVFEQIEYSAEMNEECECSQDQDKFVYETAGLKDKIEYSICRGSAEEVMQMLKDESVVVWRYPQASVYELFKNRGAYALYQESLESRISNYAFYVARRDEMA